MVESLVLDIMRHSGVWAARASRARCCRIHMLMGDVIEMLELGVAERYLVLIWLH